MKIQPPGVLPIREEDRQPVIKVVGGDSWTVDLNLYNPLNPAEPATPDNTLVRVVLAETQFEDELWDGIWFDGVYPDENRNGLCHIKVPREVTRSLRRGSYLFSVRVSDILDTVKKTEAQGSFLVEYAPTSDQHSIPYKDGTSGDVIETLDVVRDIEAEFDAFKEKFDFNAISALTDQDSLNKVKTTTNGLLTVLKKVNK